MFTDTTKLQAWLKESAFHYSKTKAFSRKVREYYNGDQLDDTIKLILANRGQPEQYENNIAKHNNSILGFKKEREIEIRLFGRQQQDRTGADMLNALLKAITSVSDYEDEIDSLDDELSIEGVAIAELTIKASGEFDEFGREHKDVEVNHVPSSEMFLDPFSKRKNYTKDARYISRCFWIDKDELPSLGFSKEKIGELTSMNYLSDVVDDDLHTDETITERVLLCYTWYRKWDDEQKKNIYYYCFWSNDTILLQAKSPYQFEGFPYEVAFLHRDFKGKIKYWGLYKDIMPIQDHINYAKLRLQNMLSGNKTLVNKNALLDEDIEQFNEDWSFDNATVVVDDINGIKEIRQNAQIQQILNIIIDSRNQISELLNSNKEMLGQANNRMSAVGQEQRISTGLVGLSRFMNGSDSLQKRIIKKTVEFIKQYYDTQRIVSIIDEDYMQSYLIMNESNQNAYGAYDYEVHEDGSVSPVSKNRVDVGKYDLIFIAKPKSNSQSSERLRHNVELLKLLQSTDPHLVKYLLPDILKDSGSPSARKIKEIIEQQDSENSSSPLAQENAQLKSQLQGLEMIHKQSQTNLNNAKALALTDKNKIDLQKAYSSSLVAIENVQAKKDKNTLDAMRGIR